MICYHNVYTYIPDQLRKARGRVHHADDDDGDDDGWCGEQILDGGQVWYLLGIVPSAGINSNWY